MGLLAIDGWYSRTISGVGTNFMGFDDARKVLPANLCNGSKFDLRTSAARKPLKKSRKNEKEAISLDNESKKISKENNFVVERSYLSDQNAMGNETEVPVASRSNVLKACFITSGLIAALGLVIRQVSHVASLEGLSILDCSAQVSFGFEAWHLELIIGSVILVSSCRYFLLKTWPDFAESSEAANRQVLTSLEPVDYLVVAFFPGISEEILFRGALLPLFGFNLTSVLAVAAIFGILHLGSGRKYSYVIWSTFVGCVYGYATILSSSVVVPMASHALNNLVGGVLWRNK